MRKLMLLGAAAAALGIASPAAALVTIYAGPGAVQPDENLLFNNGPEPGLTLQGITNQSNTMFTLTGGETLVATGGQARLDAQDGTIDTAFTFNGFANQLVGFGVQDGFAFTEAEFRLFGGTATRATITFVDTSGGVFTRTANISPNGFFSAIASDGQLIDYFSVAANGSIGDVRQVRVGGIQSVGVIPEPATWAMMLLGFGSAGALMRRKRSLALA